MQFNMHHQLGSTPPGGRPPGLFAKIVATLAAVAMAIVAFMFSIVLFAVAITVGLLIWAYLWWKMRGLRKRMKAEMGAFKERTSQGGGTQEGDVLEGVVIREVDEDDPRSTSGPRRDHR